MALSIRMRREGTTNSPYYRVIVAEKRSKRDGKYIEQLGTYDPKKKVDNFNLKLDRVEYWIKNGAQPSETVASMVKKLRKAAK